MSIFSSSPEARLGSLGIAALFPLPPLPNIVAEWAAIVPLVCHLASQRDDYITTGDVALMGRLSVGIFPSLGTLSGLARLLGRGTKYLDYASTRGGSGRTVWDVNWGSVFPCANGAAFTAVSKCLMGRGTSPPKRMPETPPSKAQTADCEKPSAQVGLIPKQNKNNHKIEVHDYKSGQGDANDAGIRRYQLLHVYQLHWTKKQYSRRHKIDQLFFSIPGQVVKFFLLIGSAVLLGLLGVYGSAALIVCTSVSELVAFTVTIRRPRTYLQNGETHDACMLVASHVNATEWHLYIGDRAIADTILNKPMFVVPEGKSAHLAAHWFSLAHLLQLTAMTFVAAQKGWDGVLMLVLLGIHRALHRPFFRRTSASEWLEREGIGAKVKSFEFSGRHAMMGAIQVFSGSAITRWMDEILVPHPRREAWLEGLRGKYPADEFSASDAKWLESAVKGSLVSAGVLKSVFGASGKCEASA